MMVISIGIVFVTVGFVVIAILGIYLMFFERPRAKHRQRRDLMLRHFSDEHREEF
jgi:uncharacterized membrane protein